MAVLRRAARSDATSSILSWCVAGYIKLIWLTGRWRIEASDEAARLMEDHSPLIACFWHGRMLVLPNLWRKHPAKPSVLVSQHRDGVFLSRTVARLGIGTVAGSTSRGGGAALLGIVRALRRGESIGITPDGPRGPLMRAAPGAAIAAGMSGAPLLPVTYGARSRIVASSWDRFVIPLPFTRGIIRISDPISVSGDADEAALADISRRLETELIRMTEDVDRELGVNPVRRADDSAAPAKEGAP
ncbi:MAG: lysophospholipid acyltransferase family protein [Alphaproteobacteria bacterium]